MARTLMEALFSHQDWEFPAHFPLHVMGGDRVTLRDGTTHTFVRATRFETEADLVAFLKEQP